MNNETIQHPRRLPTEGVFMSFKIDDIVYGYLQGIATYKPGEKTVYLTEAQLNDAKRVLKDLLGTSSKTIKRKVDMLIQKNLLAYDANNRIYSFLYDTNEKYCIVSADLLLKLTSVYNHMAVRTYVYLLDKFLWKQKENDVYNFTLKELKMAFGYSEGTRGLIENILREVLDNLKYNNYINYESYYDNEHSPHPIPRMKLTFVARTVEDLGYNFSKELTPEEQFEKARLDFLSQWGK